MSDLSICATLDEPRVGFEPTNSALQEQRAS